ncbi:MAG TPA: plastocyanin/azurin family copper-binding protein [Chloroflexota bacterium]|jgi:plastocyanin|nr:plastocyanin/azurin family copper-binding protein [Chloroflexota bacterium]
MRSSRIALIALGMALFSASAVQAAGGPTSTDGQSLATQSPDTQSLFQSVWGPNAATRWIEEHLTQMGLLGGVSVPVAVPAPVAIPAKVAPVLLIMNDKDQFVPSMLSVPRGTTITWRNDDTDPHTITGDPAKSMPGMKMVLPNGAKAWDSGLIEAGQSFSVTLDTPGHYLYICTVHAGHGMIGTIDVS